MAVLEDDFYHKLLQVANNVGMRPEDILNVMAIESGINPGAHNKNGNASGLIQFMPKTLKNLGYKGTHSDFRQLSATDQLDYVEKLIKDNTKINGAPFSSATQYYIANFLPVALRLQGIKQKNPNTIIVSKNPDKPHLPGISMKLEQIYYNANPGLDADKDGHITYGDIDRIIKQKAAGKTFRNAVSNLTRITGYKPTNRPNIVNNKSNFSQKLESIDKILNQYLSKVVQKSSSNKINLIIKISSKNISNSIEFGRILSLALSEELKAKNSLHIENDQIELEARVNSEEELVVKELSTCLAKIFSEQNEIISISQHKNTSNLPMISLEKLSQEHRKFLFNRKIK